MINSYDVHVHPMSIPVILAWTGGLCWKHFGQYFENSIVEDHYTGIVATLAAHELGHK
jgi:hypothetical protein